MWVVCLSLPSSSSLSSFAFALPFFLALLSIPISPYRFHISPSPPLSLHPPFLTDLTPKKDSYKATSLRIDRILASPSILADLCAYLHGSGFRPTHRFDGPNPTPTSKTQNQYENGDGSHNEDGAGAQNGDRNGHQSATGTENGDGNQNGTRTGTGSDKPKEKANEWNTEDIEALVSDWKPYLLWYMLEVGVPASPEFSKIARSMAFREWCTDKGLLGWYVTAGGGGSGVAEGPRGGMAASFTDSAHLFSALMGYSANLRYCELTDWAVRREDRQREKGMMRPIRRKMLGSKLEPERDMLRKWEELEERAEREGGLMADLVGLDMEFLAFCARKEVSIVPFLQQ